jgi:serine/threonine-protein kinase
VDPRLEALPARYTIEREVGRGGSSRVYVAIDSANGQRVAIKVLHPELAGSVSALRFQREVRVLTSLEHPGILPVLDSAVVGNALFYVMPYLDGTTLLQRLASEGALPYAEVVEIVRVLASAIDYAHSRNVVHRDIKPANVLFDGARPVIADFGIARAIIAASSESGVSSSGLAIGTPLYMSPEQSLDPNHVDGRADIYSLGCIAFEMLSGRPPFTGATSMAILAKHVSETPPLVTRYRSDVPPQAATAIAAAMAKEPRARPKTASALAQLMSA